MADALDALVAGGEGVKPEGGEQDDGAAAGFENRSAATEIIVRADLEALLGDSGGYAEILGCGPIPPSALQRLCCNAGLSVVLFSDELTPLYETAPSRAPTAAQRRALIARDGACVGCGAAPHQPMLC